MTAQEAVRTWLVGQDGCATGIGALEAIGWPAVASHDRRIARLLRYGLAAIPCPVPAPRLCAQELEQTMAGRTRRAAPSRWLCPGDSVPGSRLPGHRRS